MTDQSSPNESSVQVVIRLQPPQNSDIQLLSTQTLCCLNKQYNFDHIFAQDASQEQIYEQIGMKMIASAKKGYNCCIFAYGQTGSGKTYTMTGTETQDGLIQRTLKGLFKMLEGFESFQLKLSYCEIYNEQVNDLLFTNANRKSMKNPHIKIKESLTLGFYLQNLQEIKVEGISDMIEQLDKGIKNRTTAQTKMNRESSRSHSILTLLINTRQKRQNEQGFSIKSSKMHFVDLAGSQKQKSTHAAGDRLKQASSINKSLTSLSIVIEKLSSKATHIPYRDSVLTKILRDSLGGNSKTILIATLSSKEQSMPETISTLNFAVKAKKVKLAARVNEEYEGSVIEMRKRIKELEEEIKILKNKQIDTRCSSCDSLKTQYETICSQISQIEAILAQKQQKIQQYGQLVYRIQEEHQHQISQLMHKLHEYENSPQSNDLSRILQRIDQKQSIETNAGFVIMQEEEDNYLNENQQFGFRPTTQTPQLSIIPQHPLQNQVSQTHPQDNFPASDTISEISFQTFKANTFNPQRNEQISKSLHVDKTKIKYQNEEGYLEVIKELREKNAILECQINICRAEMENNVRENQRKLQENKRVYEPIIKQWVQTNGNTIKQNLKARNAIEQDLIMGLKAKNQSLKKELTDKQQKWHYMEEEYKKAIDKIIKIGEDFKAAYKKKRRQLSTITQELSPNEAKRQQMNGSLQFRNTIVQTSPVYSQGLGNQNPSLSPSYLNMSQVNTENITKIQEELDRQEVMREQLTRQLEDYKLKAERLENQITENRDLASYWEGKYNTLLQGKKEMERNLQGLLKEKGELLVQINNNAKRQEQIPAHWQNLLKKQFYDHTFAMQIKQCQYEKKCQQLNSQLASYRNLHNQDTDKLRKLQQNLCTTLNANNNLSTEVQNCKACIKSLQKRCKQLQSAKEQAETQCRNARMQHNQYKQNHAYTIDKYNIEMKQKAKQISDLQKQGSKEYLQKIELRDQCRLLALQLKQTKQNYDKLKAQKQQLYHRNKGLQQLVEQDQSQACRKVQRLNDLNVLLQQKLERSQQRLGLMMNEFAGKSNEIKYWKEECEKHKRWKQDFRKMQEEFLVNQERDRSRDKASILANTSASNKATRQNERRRRTKQKQPSQPTTNSPINPLLTWEHEESMRQIKDITNRLGQICNIQLNESNVVLKLDEIAEKINQIGKLKDENKKLEARNRVLVQGRNSEFWGRIN